MRSAPDGGAMAADMPFGDRIGDLVRAIREGDDAMVEDAVLRLSRSRRWLAPLGLAVGAFIMLFAGLKLVFSNWRLTLVQILPAMWVWLAMFDLKLHVLHGKTFHALTGPVVVPLVLAVAVVTALAFYLNAVFAFAIARGGRPEVRAGIADAREHMHVVLAWGLGVGVLLGFATIIATRWGRPWFTLALGVVVGVMMVCYVAVPSSLIGVKRIASRRDKLAASAVSGALGAAVTAPGYLLGRIGILLLGSHTLFALGVVVLVVGLMLQAGATGAVKAVKLSATLLAGKDATVA
jgi:hypothetical protein